MQIVNDCPVRITQMQIVQSTQTKAPNTFPTHNTLHSAASPSPKAFKILFEQMHISPPVGERAAGGRGGVGFWGGGWGGSWKGGRGRGGVEGEGVGRGGVRAPGGWG